MKAKILGRMNAAGGVLANAAGMATGAAPARANRVVRNHASNALAARGPIGAVRLVRLKIAVNVTTAGSGRQSSRRLPSQSASFRMRELSTA